MDSALESIERMQRDIHRMAQKTANLVFWMFVAGTFLGFLLGFLTGVQWERVRIFNGFKTSTNLSIPQETTPFLQIDWKEGKHGRIQKSVP